VLIRRNPKRLFKVEKQFLAWPQVWQNKALKSLEYLSTRSLPAPLLAGRSSLPASKHTERPNAAPRAIRFIAHSLPGISISASKPRSSQHRYGSVDSRKLLIGLSAPLLTGISLLPALMSTNVTSLTTTGSQGRRFQPVAHQQNSRVVWGKKIAVNKLKADVCKKGLDVLYAITKREPFAVKQTSYLSACLIRRNPKSAGQS
jgi:hypothetical protein